MRFKQKIIRTNNTGQWFLYFAYVVVAVVFFIYFLFPSEAVKKYISYSLGKAAPGLNVTIDQVKPAFPFCVRLYETKFYYLKKILFGIEQARTGTGLFPFFGSKNTFYFKGRAYDGDIDVNALNTKKDSANNFVIEAKLDGIRIKDIPAMRNLTEHTISGILGGQITWNNSSENVKSAVVKFELSDFKLEFITPVFNVENLFFSKINIRSTLSNKKLDIQQCVLNGRQADGDVGGFVMLREPLCESNLSLSGTIKPHPLFLAKLDKKISAIFLLNKKPGAGSISFQIGGTIEKPEFSLN